MAEQKKLEAADLVIFQVWLDIRRGVRTLEFSLLKTGHLISCVILEKSVTHLSVFSVQEGWWLQRCTLTQIYRPGEPGRTALWKYVTTGMTHEPCAFLQLVIPCEISRSLQPSPPCISTPHGLWSEAWETDLCGRSLPAEGRAAQLNVFQLQSRAFLLLEAVSPLRSQSWMCICFLSGLSPENAGRDSVALLLLVLTSFLILNVGCIWHWKLHKKGDASCGFCNYSISCKEPKLVGLLFDPQACCYRSKPRAISRCPIGRLLGARFLLHLILVQPRRQLEQLSSLHLIFQNRNRPWWSFHLASIRCLSLLYYQYSCAGCAL